MDFKKQVALKAATVVTDKTIVGLGAGSTIAHLVEALQVNILQGLRVLFVTSSFSTLQLLQTKVLPVQPVHSFTELDIYFDGCDQLDHQLHALKSGGGIHTQEKLLASMAKEFILIGDRSKLVEAFNLNVPVVLEILPEAAAFIPFRIRQIFAGVKTCMRISKQMDGPVITQNGNFLLDLHFQRWPALSTLNPVLKSIAGVVETSLFYGLAHRAILGGDEGVFIKSKEKLEDSKPEPNQLDTV